MVAAARCGLNGIACARCARAVAGVVVDIALGMASFDALLMLAALMVGGLCQSRCKVSRLYLAPMASCVRISNWT
ncbi:MAG: hypothetical protein ACI8W7_002735 [Gammaproteobacteria bacterium]|jgi:hypothetical protein